MAESDLDYALVTGRFALAVADSDDPGDNPDVIYCNQGTVEFTPLITFEKVAEGTPWPFEAGHSVFVAEISDDDYVDPTVVGVDRTGARDGAGHLTWRGKPFIKLIDLTSSKINPNISDPAKATHSVAFKNVKAVIDGTPVNVNFPARPGRFTKDGPDGDGKNDLIRVLPVVTGSSTPITVGPRGISIVSAAVSPEGELLFTFSDDTEQSAGELPGTADAIEAATTATAAADTATTKAGEASTAATDATTAKDDAEVAKADAETAKVDAQTAKSDAEAARADLLGQKAQPSGIAPLDGSSKVPTTHLPTATATGVGAVELATNTEATTGTDTQRAVTPAGVKAVVDTIRDLSDATFANNLSASIDATGGGLFVRKDTLVYNVVDHGLVGDAVELTDCYVAAGSNQLTSPSANFTNADIGKAISIGGAGTSGAALTSSPGGNLRTIASVIDAHTITFDDPAHGTAVTAVVAARSVTAATTIGSNVVTASDGAFTASDVGKTISIPNAFGDAIPTVRSRYGAMTSGSATLTSTYAAFTTADVGKYVRVAGAAGSGQPLVAKITARATATSVTLDTNASATVTDVTIIDLGTPRTIPVAIVAVDSATQVKIRKMADFTVAATASAVSGQSVVYGTDNRAALAALVAAVPNYATLFFPTGIYFLASSSVTLSKPVTLEGANRRSSLLHIGASTGRLVAGSSNVTLRKLGFQGIQGGGPVLLGSAAANSFFTDWTFDRCLFLRSGISINRQGRVGNTGVVTSTGTGHSARVLFDRCEWDDFGATGLTASGVDQLTIIEPYVHDGGLVSTATVGIKIDGARFPKILGGVVSGNIGDGVDVFDSYAPTIDGVRGWLNGVKLIDTKWIETANYNSPERGTIANVLAFANWGGGLNLSAPRLDVSNVKAIGNYTFGIQRAKGATGATVSASYSTFTNIEASGNTANGIKASGGVHDHWIGVVANGNGQSGFENGGTDTHLADVVAFGNLGPSWGSGAGGIYHTSTAVRSRQRDCMTQDANGQYAAHASATRILVNMYGEEAAGAGSQPTSADWPMGALVKNTSDSTYWRKASSGWVAGSSA